MSVHKEKQTRESKATNETDQGATRNKMFEFGVSFLPPNRQAFIKNRCKLATTADEALDKDPTLLATGRAY